MKTATVRPPAPDIAQMTANIRSSIEHFIPLEHDLAVEDCISTALSQEIDRLQFPQPVDRK